MRILAYSNAFDRSGAPIVLFRLLRALARRHTVHVLDVACRDRDLVDDYRASGIALVDGVSLGDYDVGLFNTLLAAPKVAEAGSRLPVLWWIHEAAFGLELIADPRHGIGGASFRAARAIVFPTEWQATSVYARHLAGGAPWHCVPYGVDDRGEPADGGAPCPFRREAGRLHLVQLGAICHRKGHDVVAAALERLGDPGIVWICVGDEHMYPDFAAAIRGGAVAPLCVGVRNEAEVSAFLRHCDAVLCPTRDDLIPLSILEAMAHARCVVASDYGPIPETVVDGETGLLAPVGDAPALAAAIGRLRRDPGLAGRLGEAGLAVLRRRHGFAAHVAGMEAALAGIARRAPNALESR